MKNELKIIKKKYGEGMMHFCRSNFSTILDQKNLLLEILSKHFLENEFLYDDLVKYGLELKFINNIYSFAEQKTNHQIVDKSPEELLKTVGYTLYECKTEEEIQEFKKYYEEEERLCTFNGGRLNWCYVWFAVKDNAKDLKRADFKTPKRQDEYGTSVISIQFTKDESHRLSIKNRYNIRVANPDATFSNNLDNIIEGLTESFSKYYGMTQSTEFVEFKIPGYYKTRNAEYYKIMAFYYNSKNYIRTYICSNNVVIYDNSQDNEEEIKSFSKNQYIILDYYVLDLKNKTIKSLINDESDSFLDTIDKIINIEVVVDKEKKEKEIKLKVEHGEDIIIRINQFNQIIKLVNNNVQTIGDGFLINNESLQELSLPKVEKIGATFLCSNKSLQELSLPKVKTIGNAFLGYNNSLQKLSLPKVEKIGDNFLDNNKCLQKLDLSSIKTIEDDFLWNNEGLQELYLPNVKKIGKRFLYYNKSLQELYLPNVQTIGEYFLCYNTILQELSLPNVKTIGECFLIGNANLQKLSLPNVQAIGNYFLYWNKSLQELYLPKVEIIGYGFLYWNEILQELSLPKVEKIGDCFLYNNKCLQKKLTRNNHDNKGFRYK